MTTAAAVNDFERTRAAVLDAGRIAMRHFRQPHESWEKGPGQLVTEADIEVDRFLKQALCPPTDDAAWLSEEAEDDPARLTRRRVWIVDPIDGTRSFADGVAEFAICVALLDAGELELGFVYNPATEEMFEAARGRGATRNGAAIRASGVARLDEAHIVAGRFESRRREFKALIPTAALSYLGSLAYKLALVAAGRYDGYLSWRRTNDWDIAAAALVLAESGAVITDAGGGAIRLNQPEPTHSGILAATAALHPQLLVATAGANAAYRADRRARGLPA
ncbi:MAG: inositol monophosphatase family protein [Geminicoccaceae bacterium]